MLDVFNQQIEDFIKEGMSHIYWYKKDLRIAWTKSGVPQNIINELFNKRNEENRKLSKRELMNELYFKLRAGEYNRRLEISRNFVRTLIERKTFVRQDPKHQIEKAEFCSMKLKEIVRNQNDEKRDKEVKKKATKKEPSFSEQLKVLENKFYEISGHKPQTRGKKLEDLFYELMKISGIETEKSYRVVGEEIDGAIKYDGHYYLVELKWHEKKIGQKDISSLYMKVEGKLESRGIFISMNGYSSEVLESLKIGKTSKVILLDGTHIMNLLTGRYSVKEMLDYCIKEACLKGNINPSANIYG